MVGYMTEKERARKIATATRLRTLWLADDEEFASFEFCVLEFIANAKGFLLEECDGFRQRRCIDTLDTLNNNVEIVYGNVAVLREDYGSWSEFNSSDVVGKELLGYSLDELKAMTLPFLMATTADYIIKSAQPNGRSLLQDKDIIISEDAYNEVLLRKIDINLPRRGDDFVKELHTVSKGAAQKERAKATAIINFLDVVEPKISVRGKKGETTTRVPTR